MTEPTKLTDEQLDELERLGKVATARPWAQQEGWPLHIVPHSQRKLLRGGAANPAYDAAEYAQTILESKYDGYCDPFKWTHRRINKIAAEADAALVVALRNTAPALIAELRALRAENAALRALRDEVEPVLRYLRSHLPVGTEKEATVWTHIDLILARHYPDKKEPTK